MRVVKALDEGAVAEHIVKARTAGTVEEDGFAAWCSTVDRHVTTDDWRMQRGRESVRTVVEMTYGYGHTSAEFAHVLGVSGYHRPYPAQQCAPQAARERTGGITPMAHGQSSLPPASRPDITAFAEELRARLPQRRMLPPEEVQGLERLGRWVRVLRTRHRWSPSTLTTQTGLPWVSLALLEQGMLLPDELTPAVLHQLGRAFPLQHAGPTPMAPAAPPWPAMRQEAMRPPLYDRLVRWISPLWQPPMAGVPVTAAAPPTQTQTFYPDEGGTSR
jgi:hypothetical protein